MVIPRNKVAVIEDDRPTSEQLAGWIRAARPELQVDQWFDRDAAEAALARERYEMVVLDIELGRERNAGIALINEINKLGAGTPVLVVSAMPAAIYRGIMKALDAWDYLQKTSFDEAEFIDTFLDILRAARARASAEPAAAAPHALQLDPLWQRSPLWKGGGNVHGPQPRDWSYQIPKKMRRGAVRSVLTERLREGGLIIVEDFNLSSHKTKDFLATLAGLGLDGKTLIVTAPDNQNLVLSSRNLPNVTHVSPNSVNVYELLTHERIAFTRDAVGELDKQLSGK